MSCFRGIPRPALNRENSLTRGSKPTPPAVPPKRSSLTRSDLALFSDAVRIKNKNDCASLRDYMAVFSYF